MAELQLSVSDVKVNAVTLTSTSFLGGTPYDLIPHLREINIYENIFSNALTANITLDEAVNLPAKFPIVGEERVFFDMVIPGMKTSKHDGTSLANILPMYVHKTSNRKLTAPQSTAYSLELVSAAYMRNIHSRISKAYCDKSASEIAGDIWYDYLWNEDREGPVMEMEDTERIEQCVIPNWTPFKAINWLAGRSTSKRNPSAANYVFYENITGHKFKSLDSMMGDDSILLFTLEPAHTDPYKVEYLANRSEPLPIMKCDSIDLVQQPEMVKNINRGCYASKLITHDIITDKITQHSYNLNKNWDETSHLNKEPPVRFAGRNLTGIKNVSFGPLSDNDKESKPYGISSLNNFSDSVVLFSPKHDRMYAKNPNHQYDNEVEKWRLQRNSQMTLFDGTKFFVQCGGIPALRVGMCADIHMMSPEAYRKHEDSRDEVLSGKCMVTAIRHVITNIGGNTEYKMVLELSKDGIGQ